jgi:predicted phosphate transport protein (TIGR00153 family)
MFSILPKEMKFFDMFDQQADNLMKASSCFRDIVASGNFDDKAIQVMRDIEHVCDDVTHDIIDKLNRTFITPFDREDIHALAHEMDNVVDNIYTITKRMKLYKLNVIDSDMIQFSKLIDNSVVALANALKGLRNHKDTKTISDLCIEINKLENDGDYLRDQVIGRLLDEYTDPIQLIKWKEVYEGAETVLDICEDVANVVESILVKQG